MQIRIKSPGFEGFTGPLGTGTMFEDGVSVGEVSHRAMMRIGAIFNAVEVLEDGSDGPQIGPSAMLVNIRADDMPVAEQPETGTESDEREANEAAAAAAREAYEKDEAEKVEAERKAALEAARLKAESETPVVYTREELEAIGANDGIAGLREIGEKIDASGRSINELVVAILRKQTKALTS